MNIDEIKAEIEDSINHGDDLSYDDLIELYNWLGMNFVDPLKEGEG